MINNIFFKMISFLFLRSPRSFFANQIYRMEEGPINGISWDDIRDHYNAKKRSTRAVGISGRDYGPKLLPPFSEKEICEFEKRCDLTLPSALRIYLIAVSREVFVSSYPREVYLYDDKTSCSFPAKLGWIERGENTDDGMLCIGYDGCAFSILIIIKGNQHGSVWYSTCSELYLDEDTFEQYITRYVKPK